MTSLKVSFDPQKTIIQEDTVSLEKRSASCLGRNWQRLSFDKIAAAIAILFGLTVVTLSALLFSGFFSRGYVNAEILTASISLGIFVGLFPIGIGLSALTCPKLLCEDDDS
ncbi:MAG: hypothetical protein JJU12_04780 [Chlamydiales bacterium]|nr:hypothetical protein [Chlamydiales bacterium]